MKQNDFIVHGNFLGTGNADTEVLYEEKATGSLIVSFGSGHWEERVGGLGPEWSLKGVADYLGDERDQILIENRDGALYLGEVNHAGLMTYKSLGGLGPEWHFLGSADYLHNGHAEYMIENNAGHIAVGDAAALNWGSEYTWLS